MNLLTSKVTWAIVGLFIIGGLEQLNVIPVGVGDAIIAALGLGGLYVHNGQIATGKVA